MTAVKAIISTLAEQGFDLSLTATGGLAVTPASRLSDQQRGLIRDNRVAITAHLSAANDAAPPTLPSPDPFDDRRTCTSCRNLWPGNRCLAHRAAGLKARDLGADYANLPKRCRAWAS